MFNIYLPYLKKHISGIIRINTPLKPLNSKIKIFSPNQTTFPMFIYNPRYFNQVRDQGNCGACWAFVICCLMEYDIKIKVNEFNKYLDVQHLINCYPDANGCNGAIPELALIWIQANQFKININNVYLQKMGPCVFVNQGFTILNKSVYSLCEYIKEENIINPTQQQQQILNKNIYNMKQQLINNGPFFTSISVYSDFVNFNGETVYSRKSNDFIGGHAVLIVGYADKGTDNRPGFEEGYWVIRNSWGTLWSPNYDFEGYCAIRMGINECGIESRSGCAETNVSVSRHLTQDMIITNLGDLQKSSYTIRSKKI